MLLFLSYRTDYQLASDYAIVFLHLSDKINLFALAVSFYSGNSASIPLDFQCFQCIYSLLLIHYCVIIMIIFSYHVQKIRIILLTHLDGSVL